jgi:hypothetical protein
MNLNDIDIFGQYQNKDISDTESRLARITQGLEQGARLEPVELTPAEERVAGLASLLQKGGERGVPLLGTFRDPRQAYQMSQKLLRLVDPKQQGGIGELLPVFSFELASERDDPLGQGLSLLDLVPLAGPIAKTATKKGIEGIASLDQPKDMLFVHNTREDAIKSFDQLGGIPSPSLAVQPADIPLRGYGEIQLIGKPKNFDPAVDPRNKVYSADAYTPRAPKPIRLAKPRADEQLAKDYAGLKVNYGDAKEILQRGTYALRNLQGGFFFNPADGIKELEAFLYSPLAKRKYAKEKGLSDNVFNEYDEFNTFPHTKDFDKWAKKEKDKYLSRDAVIQYFDDAKQTTVTKPYTLENAVNSMIKENQRGGEGLVGGYSPSMMRALMSKEYKDLSDIKADRGRIAGKLEYPSYLESQVDDLLEQYKFPVIDTKAGSNMVNNIGIALEEGKKFNQDLLKDVYNQNIDFDQIKFIEVMERQAGQKPTFKFDYNNPPKGFLDDLENIFLKNATKQVDYFESKPIRSVGFDEFAGAIVPEGTDKEVVDILKKRGLKVIKNDPKNDPLKTKARQKFKDQMFSFAPVVGAGGIATLTVDDKKNRQ